MAIDVHSVHEQPALPAKHSLRRWPVIRSIRCDPVIDRIHDHCFLIMLERNKEIRKHSMDPSAGRIITLMAGDGYPLCVPAFRFTDPPAVIAESEKVVFALWTKIFAAVR